MSVVRVHDGALVSAFAPHASTSYRYVGFTYTSLTAVITGLPFAVRVTLRPRFRALLPPGSTTWNVSHAINWAVSAIVPRWYWIFDPTWSSETKYTTSCEPVSYTHRLADPAPSPAPPRLAQLTPSDEKLYQNVPSSGAS